MGIDKTVSQRRFRGDLRARLAVADRMASLGMLAAGAAHDLSTPLTCILTNLEHVRRALEELAPVVALVANPVLREAATANVRNGLEAVADALQGTSHAVRIVRDLKELSRPAERNRAPVDMRSALDRALRLVAPDLRHRARVVTKYRETPPVFGSEG